MGRRNGNTPPKRQRKKRDQRDQRPTEHIERDGLSNMGQRGFDQLHDPRSTQGIKDKLDRYQMAYYKNCRMSEKAFKVVIVDEPAGTGKTTVAFAAGVEALRTGKVKRLTYIRFPSKRGQRLGAIPGDLKEKEALYMQPAYEALAACGIQPAAVELLISQGLIRLCTDTTLRGTNIPEEFVIIDEAQNAEDLEQLKLILTRVHDSSKVVLIGDSGQKDGRVQLYYGLTAFQVYTVHLMQGTWPTKSWAVKHSLYNNYRGDVAMHADRVGDTLKEIARERGQ